jgi:hypothetical protein
MTDKNPPGRTPGGYINQPVFFLLVLGILLSLAPQRGAAQTGDRTVALMLFAGDDQDMGVWLQTVVAREVEAFGGYTAQRVNPAQYPETLCVPPNQPPAPAYPGNAPYVLTGEYSVDADNLWHFQLWLWISSTGALVYTDRIVFRDNDEAERYVASMIRWMFLYIPGDIARTRSGTETDYNREDPVPKETGDRNPFFTGRFHLGMRQAVSFNTYYTLVSGDYHGSASHGLGIDGALLLDFRLFRLLSLQTEIIISYDTFTVENITQINTSTYTRSRDKAYAMSLMFPLMIKVPLALGKFTVSPFMGLYFVLPLGSLNVSPEGSTGMASYNYSIDPPLGLLFGIEAGLTLGPGQLFLDFRYDRDLGKTSADKGSGIQYARSRIGMSLGYKFLLQRQRS